MPFTQGLQSWRLTGSKAESTGPPLLLSVGVDRAPLLSRLGLLGASGLGLPCWAGTVVSVLLLFFCHGLSRSTPLSPPSTNLYFFILQHVLCVHDTNTLVYTLCITYLLETRTELGEVGSIQQDSSATAGRPVCCAFHSSRTSKTVLL